MDDRWRNAVRGPFLKELDTTISQALSRRDVCLGFGRDQLLEVARQACLQRDAKRLRPQLVLLCGSLLGAPRHQMMAVAAASELIHTGSLLHDDIIDGASQRRNQPTATVRWGSTVAVLAGDLALSLGLKLLHCVPQPVIVGAVHAIALMSQGASAEAQARGSYDLPIESWRRIAEFKTGALFAFCGLGAAHLVGDEDAVDRFQTFGYRVGVAFQIADDLLDLVSDKGRERFADLRNREVSFPTLLAARSSAEFARLLEEHWNGDSDSEADVQSIAECLLATGIIEASVQHIHDEIEGAIEALGGLSERPGGEDLAFWAKSIERRIGDYVTAQRQAV